jgi:hypothetical protein
MMTRRLAIPSLLLPLALSLAAMAAEPLDIGSRLELLVDDYVIESIDGEAGLRLHKPTPHEVVLVTDKPWEGNTCAYYTIFQDGDLYRMYYRGSHFDEQTRKSAHPEVACYAESRDGVHWTKPELGLFEFAGTKANNIVWEGVGTHNFTVFKDANPNCTPDAHYKAFGRGHGTAKRGLYAFQSPDGIRWSLMSESPVITKGAFDSQNLAFWDSHAGLYREYHRAFRGVRDIMTGTSRDFLQWSDPVFLEYPEAPKEHLYTNAVQPYERAPHILIAFPTRYHPQRGQQVEPTFMTSRDGRTFHRWTEALIPVTAPEDRDGNRSNYMTWGLVRLPGAEREYSVYATEAYYTGRDSRVRRFTFRVDGFVSVHGSAQGGRLVTKPLRFSGNRLAVNFLTEGDGQVRVELQDADGRAISGFTLADCDPLRGDQIDYPVAWKQGTEVGSLAGKPIRIRFELQDADLFSFRFTH